MGSNTSDLWISVVGTAAGVIGAIAAIIQVYQGRQKSQQKPVLAKNPPTISPNSDKIAEGGQLFRRSDNDDLQTCVNLALTCALCAAAFGAASLATRSALSSNPLAQIPFVAFCLCILVSAFYGIIDTGFAVVEVFTRKRIRELIVSVFTLMIDAAVITALFIQGHPSGKP